MHTPWRSGQTVGRDCRTAAVARTRLGKLFYIRRATGRTNFQYRLHAEVEVLRPEAPLGLPFQLG